MAKVYRHAMEIHQLRYFVAVAESGSFSRAAERCHVAQPSLSQQIKKLERDLGQQLFDRLPRGAALTEAGHALLPRAQRILAEVRTARQALEADVEAGFGPLAVGAIPTMAPYLLPPVLGSFRAEFTGCSLTVREDLTERLVEALIDTELDVAVLSTPIDNPLLEVEVLADENLLLTMARDHQLPGPGVPVLEFFGDEPTIVLHEMHCLGQQIEGFCAHHRLQRRIVCRSTQLATIERLVALGLGVSLLPEMAARADSSGLLRYLKIQDDSPHREIAVAWRRERSRSRLARRFVELLRENLAAGRHGLRP